MDDKMKQVQAMMHQDEFIPDAEELSQKLLQFGKTGRKDRAERILSDSNQGEQLTCTEILATLRRLNSELNGACYNGLVFIISYVRL